MFVKQQNQFSCIDQLAGINCFLNLTFLHTQDYPVRLSVSLEISIAPKVLGIDLRGVQTRTSAPEPNQVIQKERILIRGERNVSTSVSGS